MTTYTLENDQCRATINAHGAELSSFIRKDLDNLEYIWEADPAVWGRHAPVLFPIVGRLPNDTYTYQGQQYRLTQHGFARDQEFALVRQTPAELVLELRANEATRALFPFEFSLLISYRLAGPMLTIGWEVMNVGTGELLFGIGAHPAFRCPLQAGETFEDYDFVFDHPVTFERYLLEGGLLNGQTESVLTDKTTLPLRYELFEQDALVLKHFDFTHVTLRSRRSGRGVRVRFDGFPYLGLWTKGPSAQFVCIEPWQGIASSVGDSGELTDKEGILSLQPGQEFAVSYSITLE
ncbi:aldose 1-epimerase family protein [Hymenobacter sp. BT186]|uniref:Aldose 1-epimerase family protein n=1 Tax=Hymenobacter telluris TaxID=2816474 RepID=A0A939EUD2_9BACT|nr:aldose 1-epimerase family protein [Hymenobacter telluris]MBO0357603.1 aldose 1-epimerase family protein [Hymenobacter telluris]MBW3373629.1 aldose 1-epimerase family protein [Hymenobacter norwichensis]